MTGINVKLSISHIDHVPSQTMPGLDNIRGSKVPRSDVGVIYEIARGTNTSNPVKQHNSDVIAGF